MQGFHKFSLEYKLKYTVYGKIYCTMSTSFTILKNNEISEFMFGKQSAWNDRFSVVLWNEIEDL